MFIGIGGLFAIRRCTVHALFHQNPTMIDRVMKTYTGGYFFPDTVWYVHIV